MVDQSGWLNGWRKARGRFPRQFMIVNLAACLVAGMALLALGQPPVVKAGSSQAPAAIPVVDCGVTPAIIGTGQTATLSVRVTGVTNLYGFDVKMTFDSTASAQFQDADPVGKTGINLGFGTFLDPDHQFSPINSVDPATGKIQMVTTVVNPGPPASGSGQLFFGTLTGGAPGAIHFTFDSAQLVDWPNAQLITNQAVGCTLVVKPLLKTYVAILWR